MHLQHQKIIAKSGFNRWLVPPAALAIHLSIGIAYGFSVFWLPLSQALGIPQPVVCSDLTLFSSLFTTTCDWRVSDLGWIYTFFFVFLGLSAALGGEWLDRVGPRKAGYVSMICWSGGMVIAALGVFLHQLWIIWLGAGVIGGIGLGLGYISPVSTLIKWFPDQRGMATGLAVMGFGGGAIIGAPIANMLMGYFQTPTDVGVWKTLLVMALFCCLAMSCGAYGYRVPPKNWIPPIRKFSRSQGFFQKEITCSHIHLRDTHRTVQFWLICIIFGIASSAGLGMTGISSPMIQELFGGKLIALPNLALNQLDSSERTAVASVAAGFTGLLFLFNVTGRFLWPYLSDWITRKRTCFFFFSVNALLYFSLPFIAQTGNAALFTIVFCVIMSLYGGGIAIVPSYLSDIFGTRYVGAIHGRVLGVSIFSGIIGPVFVNYMREFGIRSGLPEARVYDSIMYILALMMIIGLVANFCIKPLENKCFMPLEESETRGDNIEEKEHMKNNHMNNPQERWNFFVVLAWMAVIVPIFLGSLVTLKKAAPLLTKTFQ